jgi:hypothetical protein
VAHAALITVDNRGEDPEEGRRGLREELAPALRELQGFRSVLLMTAYERGRGLGVVVLETKEQAEQLVEAFAVGSAIHPGVTVTAAEVMEVPATA